MEASARRLGQTYAHTTVTPRSILYRRAVSLCSLLLLCTCCSLLAPSPSSYIERVLQTVPDFHHPDVPTYDVLEWSTPLDSSDFSPDCWVTLAQQIESHYYDYDGFVVLHGTDTMAYTASALSFMLENLGKAVIVTGAMIPLAFPVSDAKRNLIVSLMCAANLDIPEVRRRQRCEAEQWQRLIACRNSPFASLTFLLLRLRSLLDCLLRCAFSSTMCCCVAIARRNWIQALSILSTLPIFLLWPRWAFASR